MIDINQAVQLVQEAVMLGLKVGAPVILFAMVTGVAIGVFQTATQIQDHSLSFVPKIVASVVALAVFGPWMLVTLVHFATDMFSRLPHVVR